jgi:NADPH-dependent glutamate synthase beta subunit-like oxidoreductase/ferredoxin
VITYKQPHDEAPCKRACPAGIDVPRYIRLIGEGKLDEALAVIKEKMPLALVCGYICFHPCEAKCQRSEMGGPVAIKALKRFVAESVSNGGVQGALIAKPTGKSVAIVGSGPAGLTAAYFLSRLGHAATIFEALPKPGGMLRVAIPRYRLPKHVLDAEINAIKQAGVNIITSAKVDSLEDLFEKGYNAIFLTVGAHKGLRIGIEGEDVPAVLECVSFLDAVNSGEKVSMGEKVAIVGGGNAGIDAARTALRLGAKEVTVFYRRSWKDMPANLVETENAVLEGVKIQFLATPLRITRADHKLKMEFIRTKPGAVDASGRRRSEPIPGSEFSIEVDNVISAVGQAPDIPAQFGLMTGDRNTIEVAHNTLATSRVGVFAGGDAVSGPATFVEAIASGRQAAISIDSFLGGKGAIEEVLPPSKGVEPQRLGLPIVNRVAIAELPIPERLSGFSEIELTLDQQKAIQEAKRCLWCDLPIRAEAEKCTGCRTCQVRCSVINQGEFNPSKSYIALARDHGTRTTELRFSDECKNCGACVSVCNYGALTRARQEI